MVDFLTNLKLLKAMRIGIDAMGGDLAPQVAVMGTLDAAISAPECTFVLFGNKGEIDEILSQNGTCPSNVEIVHTTQVIDMGDSPTSAFQKKPDSSIVVGFNHLQNGQIDAFASAGSTGAMMVGCVYIVKSIEGVMRPTIATPLPTFDGGRFILLDVGLNIDVKPEVLSQYGLLGSIFCNSIYGIENPRIGLLNIGEEDEKGNAQSKAAHALLKEEKSINFIGNIESKSILSGVADVVLCDGFTGNIVLKLLESFSPVLENNTQLERSFIEGLNYETYGGTPVIGVNSPVIIGHGCSTRFAIKNMALRTLKVASSSLIENIKAKLN